MMKICFPVTNQILIFSLLFVSPLTFASDDEFTPHRDNYLLPYYHEVKVNQDRFVPTNPNGNAVKSTFVQFQFSIKYRVLSFEQHDLYIAYSQRSNWEAYASSAYFRDSEYNPELFYRLHVGDQDEWQISLGGEHESNGAGGTYEVSWDRGYVEIQRNFKTGYVRFKPWFRFGNLDYNPDIMDYLGYGEMEFGWMPTERQEIKLLVGNLFASHIDRSYYNVSWNFPIYQGLRGYIKAETGYGLTISNYNFKGSAYGVGMAFDF